MGRTGYDFQVRNNFGLSLDEIEAKCPAVLADSKHESRSDRYAYVSTADVIQGLRNEGIVPTMAMQARCKDALKTEFTKHLVRLRHMNDIGNDKPDVSEIILINSHDGTSSYQMMSGVFRMVCRNGLITGDIENDIRIPHTRKNIMDDVITASYTIIDESVDKMEKIQEMKTIELTKPERLLLAEFGAKARFGIKESDDLLDLNAELPFEPDKLLTPRRHADISNDLYTTFNVVQENVIKGGIHSFDRSNRRVSSRAINGIDQNVKLNKLLWAFSERMLELKRGA